MANFYYKRKPSQPRTISLGNGVEAFPLAIKCALIGDCSVGKTSLLISYTTGKFSAHYVPTIFDTYHKDIVYDGVAIDLELSDTTGLEEMERIRTVSYFETDIFIVCFSIVCPESFQNVMNKWIPEIKENLPNKPFILVGTKSDLRTNIEILDELSINNKSPIERHVGQKLASKQGAVKYLECSSATKMGVNDIFDESVRKVLQLYNPQSSDRKNCYNCNIS